MRHLSTTLLTAALVGLALAAPVPTRQNVVTQGEDDSLLLLVPTVPVADTEKSGQSLKREVEYEVIAIPGELLRREIRQVAELYGAPPVGGQAVSSAGQAIQADQVFDLGEIIVSPQQPSTATPTKAPITLPPISLPTLPPSLPTLPTLPPLQKPDLSALLSGLTGVSSQAQKVASGAGETLAAVGSGGVQAVRWLVNTKSDGIRTASRVAGDGLQYAGRLSAAVLRTLLQVPAIKARVLSEIIEASQPLVYAVSDVLSESSDDLGDIFEAKAAIVRDTMDIIIKLVQDVLALNGRIIAKLGGSGLDIGAKAFNAATRIGGAFVESAGGVATAVGGGVGDLVRVATTANFPPPPPLPKINLPQLPAIQLPKITLPSVDLSALTATTLAPLPLPSNPAPAPESLSQTKPASQPPSSYLPPGK